MKEFKLPELGENVTAGTVGKILVKAGDIVSVGQNVLEIETDKAVAEIPSSVAGKVVEIRIKEGGSVRAGEVVFLVDESAAGATAPEPKAEKAAPAPSKAEARETPPPVKTADVPAPAPAPAPAAPAAPVIAAGAVPRPGLVRATPSVRQMARELGVDLNEVPTADPLGRVTAQDVLAYKQSSGAVSAPPEAAAPPAPVHAPAAPAVPAQATPSGETVSDKWGAVVAQPMNAVRRKTAEHMAACWAAIPHVTHFEKADITGIEELRKKHGKKIEAAGGKLTVTSFILKALPAALRKFPKFNASLDLENQRVLLRQYCNIGVAVDTPNGLLVPVIRDADKKSIAELSVELPALAKKARDRKLSVEDMQGGTFTVSNLGGLGGNAFTPIINAPEVAILGMSRSQIEPVWANGQFAPRLMLPLSLSYDHRLIDGADAARFLRWLVEVLEQPWLLFLDE